MLPSRDAAAAGGKLGALTGNGYTSCGVASAVGELGTLSDDGAFYSIPHASSSRRQRRVRVPASLGPSLLMLLSLPMVS
ncbi:hypothetical protein E2562_032805 [Oryza meyeriana var. granulata]|uniref:Uncharacterized protein n=1 Tax=Oryza meyeriana var. granulata TaxID=110450 RepID=A0A6G1DQZ9_9ORYZ|nr:hypothetical protein E2562_032805 [Oryza meyeriana var. granulata]